MCGRFNVIDNPELQQLLRELGIDLGLPSRSNVAPTETIALVRQADGTNELELLGPVGEGLSRVNGGLVS